MKKIATLFSFFIGAIFFAQGIKFEDANFTTILAKAKKENKLVFIDAYTSWCAPCKLMEKKVFPQKSVSDFYNNRFINAQFDMEKGDGIKIAKKYRVISFPTYLFINGDGKEVYRVSGYLEPERLIKAGQDAENPADNELALMKKQFDAGKKDSVFLKKILSLTIGDPNYGGKVIERYFNNKATLNQQDVQILFSTIQDLNSPSYKIYKDRKTDIIKAISEEVYNNMDIAIKQTIIGNKAYNPQTKVFDDNYFLTETQKFMTKEDSERVLKFTKLQNAVKSGDAATYEKLTLEYYKDYSNIDPYSLITAANNYLKVVTNKSSLEKAILWAQQSVKQKETPTNTNILANLYNKIGDKKNAKIWAEKAIELAKSSNTDSKETQKLLDSLK